MKSKGRAPSSATIHLPKKYGECIYHNLQHCKERPSQSQGSVANGESRDPTLSKCGIKDPGDFRNGKRGCLSVEKRVTL